MGAVCHPDPLVEAVRWTISEGGVIQAIGRARGVRRTDANPVRVLLLGNLPLPLSITQAITWAEAQPSRLKVAAAEAAMRGKALPLGAADLAAVRPDLWPTPKAAEHELRGVNPETLIIGIYKGNGVYSARYRKPATSRWSLALVPAAEGQAALEEVLGVKLAGFEWQEPASLHPEASEPDNGRAGATIIVPGVDPPFDPLPVLPPPRELVQLSIVPPYQIPPDGRARLAILSGRLFQVKPPTPHGDGLDGVRLGWWHEKCARARKEHWICEAVVAGRA